MADSAGDGCSRSRTGQSRQRAPRVCIWRNSGGRLS